VDVKDKIKALSFEIGCIASPDMKECAEWMVGQMPDYFFTVPASSSGKYHPEYALGEGGLLRHTQAAVRLAKTILLTETFGKPYGKKQQDAILLALILHDGLKHGIKKNKYTVKNHPMLIRPYYEKLIAESTSVTGVDFWLNEAQRNALYNLIESHMGEWNGAGTEVMPKPVTPAQRFVHLCDYLASRKSLTFNFDV